MNKIKLTQDEVQSFAFGDLDGFEEVETVVDYEAMYKDYAPATTICKQCGTGKYYALDWDSYTSHYGIGEHIFHEDEIYEVQEVEETKIIKTWKAV